MTASTITLRPITQENFRQCINLALSPGQEHLVSSNVKSIAEAYVNRDLTPLAIHAGEMVFTRTPSADQPMVGFVMHEVSDGVGFINRLMIAAEHQGKGFGRAAVVEVIRRMKLTPEVRRIGISYQRGNAAAEALYLSLGFKPIVAPADETDPNELYLQLEWEPE